MSADAELLSKYRSDFARPTGLPMRRVVERQINVGQKRPKTKDLLVICVTATDATRRYHAATRLNLLV